MSIIERMAELLGPIARPDPRSPSPIERESDGGVDRIERAVGAHTEFSGLPELKLPEQLGTRARPARSASTSSPSVKVDLYRLRQQSIITPDGKRTPIAESFRRIKRQILQNAADPKPGVPSNLVLITSALPGEGKTFCAVNLAISIALEMDHTVLLVDADVAKPSVPQALGIKVENGLMDVLSDRRIDLAEVICRTDIEKLTFLPAGTAHQQATELLASGAMRALLQEMIERHPDRIVIFDSSPLLAASEASVLAGQMGQIVVVVEAGKTSEAVLKEALGRVDSSRIAGLVLNKGEGPRLGYSYGGYGYGAT